MILSRCLWTISKAPILLLFNIFFLLLDNNCLANDRLLLQSGEHMRGRGAGTPSLYTYSVRRSFPHDPESFTQGLVYYKNDILYESAGLYGKSTLREVDLQTGAVLRSRPLQHRDFAEGLALHQGRLVQLTWRSPRGFIYNRTTFDLVGEFDTGLRDGWGITNEHESSHELVATDSGSDLIFLHPETFQVIRKVQVHDEGTPVRWINELEWIGDEVWANIWQKECIARIDPVSGRVKGWILLQGLRAQAEAERRSPRKLPMDVLNGIAYDQQQGRLFVTGKLWPRMFELELRHIEWPPELDLKNARQLCIVR